MVSNEKVGFLPSVAEVGRDGSLPERVRRRRSSACVRSPLSHSRRRKCNSLDRDLVKRLHRNRGRSLSKPGRSCRSFRTSREDGSSFGGSSVDEDVSDVNGGDLEGRFNQPKSRQ